MRTIWVLGDQLNRSFGPLANADPANDRVLLIESATKIGSKRWHRQRLHLTLTAMRTFADELRVLGFDVDYRTAPTIAAGLLAHRAECCPTSVVVMSPLNWDGAELIKHLDVDIVANDQFLCSPTLFAEWAEQASKSGTRRLTMENFYRWQRTRLGILVEPDGSPSGGAWNFDKSNRQKPPTDGRAWPQLRAFAPTAISEQVSADIASADLWGAEPWGVWPTSRSEALQRLDDFIERGLPTFGPHQDAMLSAEWSMSHSVISPAINLGLLTPLEVIEAAETAWRSGNAPIESVEGFVRQVLGWREYVLGIYWLHMPSYRDENRLGATMPLPPVFTGDASTHMACVSGVLSNLEANAWNHHIERLMVIGNLLLTAGIDPQQAVDWMWRSYVDGAEWVMIANLIGMALYADGGIMATKPYAAGGAYINRMSDYCNGCRYNPKNRTGDDACPFTTLYWDFLARNETTLKGNHRLGNQLGSMRKLKDLSETRERAVEVRSLLAAGEL